MDSKRLYRARKGKMIGGVCAGLANYFSVDPTIVRLVFVLLFFAGASGFMIYLILWIIMPLEPRGEGIVDAAVVPPTDEMKKTD